MSNPSKVCKVYFPCIFFIAIWWLLSWDYSQSVATIEKIQFQPISQKLPHWHKTLSPLDKERFQLALSGDFNLMVELMAAWDIDAQIMQQEKIPDVKRQNPQQLLQGQLLGRFLKNSYPSKNFRNKHRLNLAALSVEKTYDRAIPQTFLAADLLLAIAPIQKVLTIPPGYLKQSLILPHDKVVDLESVHHYKNESYFLLKPQIAFLSKIYSHPHTVESLKQLGIKLYFSDEVRKIDHLQKELMTIGYLTDCSIEAELLKIFIEAALVHLDNHFVCLKHTLNDDQLFAHSLYLNHYSQQTLPSARILLFDLLKRVQFMNVDLSCHDQWAKPIHPQTLLEKDPEFLLICAIDPQNMCDFFLKHPVLKNLKAIRNHRYALLDTKIQNSSSQFIVLAYLEIYDSFLKMNAL